MTVDISSAIAAQLAGNQGIDPRGPDHHRPADYGVRATLTGHVVEIELTFRSTVSYCCQESSCHLGLHLATTWEVLRRNLRQLGVEAPRGLEARVSTVVEAGALFFDHSQPDPSRRGWYGFRPAAAARYDGAQQREQDAKRY